MTAPAIKLTITERYRLKDLTIQQSLVVPPGRVMLCKGRRIVGYCNIDDLAHTKTIEARATVICLSSADFNDVKAWLG